MVAHIYRADGREENIELDYCYSDEEVAIAVCEDGDFGSGDQYIPARYFSFCVLLTVLLVTLSIRSLQGELFITDA